MKIEKIQIKDGLFDAIYFGHVKNGKPNGKGYIKNGELDKFNKISWVNKSIIKKGIFKNGYLVKGKIRESFCKIFEGTLKNKEINAKGKIKYVYDNGKAYQEYVGEVRKNRFGYVPHGNGKLTTFLNGNISMGKFTNGLLKKGKMYWGSKKKWEAFPNKNIIKYHRGNINKRLKKL